MAIHSEDTLTADQLSMIVMTAAQQIPPLWPLNASVAVNPFLGQIDQHLAEVAARLARIAAVPVTPGRSWYAGRIDAGEITDGDLAAALAACIYQDKPTDVSALKQAAYQPTSSVKALPTIAVLAKQASAIDWPGFIAERFGAWAGGYFDQGQALWTYAHGSSAWSAFRAYATQDLTPEIIGLKGFAAYVAELAQDSMVVIRRAVRQLGLSKAGLATYFHQLLFSLGGWAQYARYLSWQAELAGERDGTLIDCLAMCLTWEVALHHQYQSAIADQWVAVRSAHEQPVLPNEDQVIDTILQEASEYAVQRSLAARLAHPLHRIMVQRPSVQAAFCIDVRSEVFRRALESLDATIQTLGFAGFFGIGTAHRDFASDLKELRLPVLLNPGLHSTATNHCDTQADFAARFAARAKRAWGRFKLAAVSCFAFVEAMGPIYVFKLLQATLGWSTPITPRRSVPHFEPSLSKERCVDLAETVLRAMSLTDHFARLVLVVGHGATVTNNPHASALHCGACGGYSGEVNARLLASLLNNADVQHGLSQRGITIPPDTRFIGARHDTTTDRVILYCDDLDTSQHQQDLYQLKRLLKQAGSIARAERAQRLPAAKGAADLIGRSSNWAELRPEWGLAGCGAFIAAPRTRTWGLDLAGKAFLHDYDCNQDSANDYRVLELIMTAPVVVASWISLQYYGSTVAPEVFGAGNKLLHNVVGGIGVFEGNGGLMRGGLPWQSVHDGVNYVHVPLRLSVCIEAPAEVMNAILARHPQVQALFDHRWLHLFAIDDKGRLSQRYQSDRQWVPVVMDDDTGPVEFAASTLSLY